MSISKNMVGQVFSKFNKIRYNHTLSTMNEMDQFNDFVKKVKPKLFLRYKQASEIKRKEFLSVIDTLNISITNQSFLDVGPAYGDALDICFEKHANNIHYVERDPFFFHYNRLKGYTHGFQINHLKQHHCLPKQFYTVIWVKGAFSADIFIQNKSPNILREWLDNLHGLAMNGAKIIICPHWYNDLENRKIVDIFHNIFTKTLLEYDYQILGPIVNHNKEPEYPITFFKIMQ